MATVSKIQSDANSGIQTYGGQSYKADASGNYKVYNPPTSSSSDNSTTESTSTNRVSPDGNITQGVSAFDSIYKNYSPPSPFDRSYEEELRQEELVRQQEDISVINNTYAGLFSKIQKDSTTRENITDVVNANAGLRGSNIGAANVSNTLEQNQEQMQGATSAQAQEVQSVINQHREYLSQDIDRERELRQTNYAQWADYVSGKETRAASSASTLLKGLQSEGYTPEELDEDFFTDLAQGTGLSPQELSAAYKYDYAQGQAASEAAASDKLQATAEYNKTIAETDKIRADADKSKNATRDSLMSKGYTYLSKSEQQADYNEADIITLDDGSKLVRPDNINKMLADMIAKASVGGGSTAPSNTIYADLMADIEAGESLSSLLGNYSEIDEAQIREIKYEFDEDKNGDKRTP